MAEAPQVPHLTEAERPYERKSRARDVSPRKQLHWKAGSRATAALGSPPGLVPLAGALGGDGGGGGGITQVPNVELACSSVRGHNISMQLQETEHYL